MIFKEVREGEDLCLKISRILLHNPSILTESEIENLKYILKGHMKIEDPQDAWKKIKEVVNERRNYTRGKKGETYK